MELHKKLNADVTNSARIAYQGMGIPAPTRSPAEVLQNLMTFRNERVLHRRKCDSSGDTILSAYSADVPFPVFKNEIWWGDQWDPLDYGREFDFSKPFFEQYAELQRVVPREGTSVFPTKDTD